MSAGLSFKELERFYSLLDSTHSFPCEYLFKCIIPLSQKESLEVLLSSLTLNFRESSQGRYLSCTATILAQNAKEILDVYVLAMDIPGAVLL